MTESSVCLQKPNSFENVISHHSLFDSQEALFRQNGHHFRTSSGDKDPIIGLDSNDPKQCLPLSDPSYGENISRFRHHCLDSNDVQQQHGHFHQESENREKLVSSKSLTSFPKSVLRYETSYLSFNGIKTSAAPRNKTKVCSVLVTRLSKKLLSKARVRVSKRDFRNLFGNKHKSNKETLHQNHTNDFRRTVKKRLKDEEQRKNRERTIRDWQPDIGYEVMQQASPLLPQLPPESAFVSNVNSYQRIDSGCGSYNIDGSLNLVSRRTFEEQQMSAMRGPLDASSFGATGETIDCSSRLCFKDESALTSGMKSNCLNSEALNLKRPLPVTFDTDESQDDCDKSVDCVKLSSGVFDTRESNNSYPSGKAYSPHYNDALRQQNDSESENFTSVFTKSMTSLYSQDSDNTFLSETNLTGDISNMDDKSSDDKEEKRKLEMMKAKVGSDESVDHQSFSISGHIEETNGFAEVNGAGKNQDLQSDYMFPSDSDMVDNRNVLKIQSELGVKEDRLSCFNYDRFSGDEPYIGAQKDGNNNRGTCDINQNDIPDITRECVNEEFADNVNVPGLILLKSAAEWEQSNSNDNSKSGDKKMNKQSNHRLFMERGFVAEAVYPNSNPDKHLTNLDRNTGSEGEYVEEDIKYCFKKPQKISALSVYTKVASDVITDVKCKRFKKRTKSCNTEYSTEPYTQEVLPNFCISNPLINANKPLKIPEDPQDLLTQTVKLVLDDLTDRVSEMCGDKMSSDDLTLMDVNKTKELLFKFCTKYLMDYRDFQDIEKVLEVRVISSTDKMHPRKGRKRQRLGKRKKDVENFSGESPEDGSRKEGENNKSQEDTNGEYRVLRSLPGRISQRHLRKAANKRFLKRYSTRNTARYNQELFNEVQDQHERQEQERYEHSKNDKMDFSSSEDSFLRHEQMEKVLKAQGENNFQLRLEDTDDEEMPSFRSNEMEGSVITLSDDTEDSVIVRTKDRSLSSGSNEMPPLSNAYDTFSSPELTKPPQLVRMEDTTKLFDEEAHKDCNANRNLENERFSPSYLTANAVNPSPTVTTPGVIKTSSYSDGNHADVLHSFDADDTDDGELVIDMDSQDTGSPASVENKGCSSSPCSISNTLDSTDSATTGSKKELQSQFLNKLHESHAQHASSEDDCIVITNEEVATPVKKEPKEDAEAREPSTESFEMLDNSMIDKDTRIEISSPPKQATTLKEAQDQDESILRTLLLDSTENVVNPTLSPEGTSQTPVISNVISLNGIKSLSPSPPALHEAISKHSISPDHNASPIPSLDAEKSPSKTPEILKPTLFPLHYGGGQCISPNPGAAPRFDTKAEVQPPPKEKTPPSVSPQPKGTEGKDGPWMQDPRHLKDKIKKLKNEIVYLQLMAEQKEKERIAIICFKRYKEEILRRIYKAYAVTVEDHVRDMFHTHKKDTNEYSHHQEHPSPSPTHPPHRQSQQPTFSPSPCDVIRPPYIRSFSESNHNAHEKHLRTILPKPAPAHMQNTPSYHSSIHQKGTCPVKPMSSHDGRTPAYGEKLPAVEAMVAKATENYGVDMRNLRDSLPARRILPKESISSTILQKVLASKEGAARSATGENFSGVPLWPVHLEQAFRNNSNSNSNNHNNNNNQNNNSHSNSHNSNNNVKSISGSPIVSKRYTPEYIPLDMIINQSSRNAESDRGLAKPQEFYRGSPESVLASHLAHSYGAKESSQIQALLSNSDPTPSKSAPSTFTSWSTQSGGRINDSHVNGNRIASSGGNSTSAARSLGALASVSQRQMNPRASPQKTAGMMFAVPPPMKSSSIQNNATSHHSHSENRESSKGNLEKMYVRKTEEGRPVMYSSLMSPNSTMPYGGHIIRNEASGSSSSTTTTTSTTAPNCPRCMGCGLSDAKYLCSGCRKHWYCSPQCQTLRWPEHSRVCAGRIYAQAPGTYS